MAKKKKDTKTSAKAEKKEDTKKSKTSSSAKATKSTSKTKKVAKTSTAKKDTSKKEESKPKKKKKPNLKYLGLIFIVGLFVVGLIAIRNQLFVATVNGKPVTRWELVRELEKQGGQQVLQTLALKKLISQEAAKQGIVVTDEDLNAEIAKVSETLPEGLTLESALASQGQSIEAYKDRIYWDLLLGKMVEEKIEVTDEEVNQYLEENRDFLIPEGDEDVNEEELKDQIREDLKAQKAGLEIDSYVQELQQAADIKYFMFVVETPAPQEQEAPQE